MKAIIDRLTERTFSFLEVLAILTAVQFTNHSPLWLGCLVVAGAVVLAIFTGDLLRHMAHLPARKRIRT